MRPCGVAMNLTYKLKTTYPSSTNSALFIKWGIGATPTSLLTDIYNNHNCDICNNQTTPEDKSLQHHTKLNNYQHTTKQVSPLQPIPTQWDYKPPPVFLPKTSSLKAAKTLQQLMEYGIAFQTPLKPNPTAFLFPNNHILNLTSNNYIQPYLASDTL